MRQSEDVQPRDERANEPDDFLAWYADAPERALGHGQHSGDLLERREGVQKCAPERERKLGDLVERRVLEHARRGLLED